MPLRTAYKLCPQAIFVDGHPERYREYSQQGLRGAPILLAAGGDGVHRRSLPGYDRHRAAARTAAAGRAPAARTRESRHAAELLHRDRGFAAGGQNRLGPGQAQRRAVGHPGTGGGVSWRRSTCARFPAWARSPRRTCTRWASARWATWRSWTRLSWNSASASGAWRWPGNRAASTRAAGSISEIGADEGPKSISHEHTFSEDTADLAQLEATLARLCEMVGRRLREHGLAARTIQLKLRYSGFLHHHARAFGGARHPARYRTVRGDPRAVPRQLEAGSAGAPAGRARFGLGRRRRANGPDGRRPRTSAGSGRWPPPTGCATASANRRCRWPPACAEISASARTRTPPGCRGRKAPGSRPAASGYCISGGTGRVTFPEAAHSVPRARVVTNPALFMASVS